jgi:hypothetical protein
VPAVPSSLTHDRAVPALVVVACAAVGNDSLTALSEWIVEARSRSWPGCGRGLSR